MTLQFGAISAERCWEQLRRVPDFRGIERVEFDAVVEHMKGMDYLFESGGLLSMGQKAERVFGRRNFLELYAVFSSPVLFRVVTEAGRDLGSLEQAFVDRLVENMSSFLLGGRAWTVEKVNHKDRVVQVRKAPAGMKPSWGGYIPQHLSFELCDRIKRILTEKVAYLYVDGRGTEHIEAQREDLGDLLRRDTEAIQLDGSQARWWTFAGGRINHTIKYGLEIAEGWKVVADNFMVRIDGDGVNHESVRAGIRLIADPEFWADSNIQRQVLARLPNYRLSKFQECLPDEYALEVVANYLLDVEGMLGWLAAT